MLKFKTLFVIVAALAAITFVSKCNAQPPGGPGGPGGPDAPDVKLVEEFDLDGDGYLNSEERQEARKAIQKINSQSGGRRRGPGRRGTSVTGKEGPSVKPADVKNYPDSEFYDTSVLRTIFLEFEADDWEKELADFKPTDVEVPCTLTVDGKVYPNVGVSFRGASSFFMIPEGLKRSLNLSMDLVEKGQSLYGYNSLNLLNCNGDASMMSSALYSKIASERIAAPKVNFIKVVINGRSWGVYANAQQFNKDFLKENFDTKKGTRWKVHGSPRGDAGLRYLGEDIEPYRERFEIKSKDDEQSWRDLINLCRVLNETPAEQLEAALEPILDIDGALWFLAVDIAVINSDGYWTRASDYSIYLDKDGKFHILPHDMNEAFRGSHGRPGGPGGGPGGPPRFRIPGFGGPPPGEGPPQGERPPQGEGPPQGDRPPQGERPPRGGFGGGPPQGGPGGPGGGEGGGLELDPLIGLENDRMPLRSKLLSIPKLQTRYLQHIRTIANDLMDWKNIGPQVAKMRELIEDEVAADTRKLMTVEAFQKSTDDSDPPAAGSLREFFEKRSAFLKDHEKIKSLPNETIELKSSKPKHDDLKTASTTQEWPHGKSTVVINEIMAFNMTSENEPATKSEDWIELYNAGDKPVELDGWYLSDEIANPHKWAFPGGTSIAAKGFLLVQADNDDTATDGLHSNFKLSAKGETVVLANDKSILDELEFGQQSADTSFGRLVPDNKATGALVPTPGKTNSEK